MQRGPLLPGRCSDPKSVNGLTGRQTGFPKRLFPYPSSQSGGVKGPVFPYTRSALGRTLGRGFRGWGRIKRKVKW